MKDILVLDIEVLRGPDETPGGWDNPHGMGFGTAVVYSYGQDIYYFFGPDHSEELIQLLKDKLVVSFNGIKFDNAVLLGNDYKPQWEDFDILNEIIKSKFEVGSIKEAGMKFGGAIFKGLSLDNVAVATIGRKKTGHGAHAPALIKEERWAEVFAYNLHDVRLTRKLWEFIKDYGWVSTQGGKIHLVDFFKNEKSRE